MDTSKLTTYQAGAAQALLNRKLQKLCDEALAPYGITKMQWLIIGTVYDTQKSGIRLSELSETLGTSMPYLTNAINMLESRGILVRRESAEDTRAKLILVSPKYNRVCKEIERTLRATLRKSIYARVDPAEFRTYLKVMEQLASG